MSHVDEGELTAYADGAYPAESTDAQRIAAHLRECADCRTRLTQSEDLRGRAAAILAYAAPLSMNAPAFEALQQQVRPARKRAAFPMAWAASIILAVGLGWFGRGIWQYEQRTASVMQSEGPLQSVPPRVIPAEPAAPQVAAEASNPQADAPAQNGLGPQPQAAAARRAEPRAVPQARVAEQARRVEVAADAREVSAPPAPPAAVPAPVAGVEGGRATGRVEPAPPLIAGLAVKSVITQGDTTVVEQTLPDGTIVQLLVVMASARSPRLSQRSEVLKSRIANEPRQAAAATAPARPTAVVQIGNRTVTLSGDLPLDSLRALAQKIR